ncbi:MAG TPA: polyprenyl synthetase family protein [candidate division Zixibacteria bacterium]|nr:polyprenyl synthetase family protein [candidate division Zixibacteria bacterium]
MPVIVTSEDIKSLVQNLAEVTAWSDLADVFDRAGGAPHPDWQLPILACQAAGGKATDAIPAAAAVACLQISIMLADDLLDEDPRGEHMRRGPGEAANLALAFQSAAFRLIDEAPIESDQKAAAVSVLARAALATAFGQHFDNQSLPGEENYWAVVSAKSTPFYGTCYALGAILANASQEAVDGFHDFGVLIGEIIQIEDDLEDAFSKPANPDWYRQGNNLLIIYGLEAEYEQREEFLALLPEVVASKEAALLRAQELLIKSGAVSYAAYHLVQRYQNAWSLLETLALPAPAPIVKILNDYGKTLSELLALGGVDINLSTLRTDSVSLFPTEGETS